MVAMNEVMNRATQVLHEVWGYSAFRGPQAEIIEHVATGGDALVLLPTGGGKSLCYQVPSLVRDGMGVVVSPLIALMQDQVAALREAGVRAEFLNSSLSWPEQQRVEKAARAGDVDILYVAPERLVTDGCLAFAGDISSSTAMSTASESRYEAMSDMRSFEKCTLNAATRTVRAFDTCGASGAKIAPYIGHTLSAMPIAAMPAVRQRRIATPRTSARPSSNAK